MNLGVDIMTKTEITSDNLQFSYKGNNTNNIHLCVNHQGIKKLESNIKYNDEIIQAHVTPNNKIIFTLNNQLLSEIIKVKLTMREKSNIIKFTKQYK